MLEKASNRTDAEENDLGFSASKIIVVKITRIIT
jgi:hypothetical protein